MIVFAAPKIVTRMWLELLAPRPVNAAPRTTWDMSKVFVSVEVNIYRLDCLSLKATAR